MNRVQNLLPEQDDPHTEQIDRHTNLGKSLDLLPGFFHFCRPVNIPDHPDRSGVGVGQALFQVGKGALPAVVAIEV